MKVKQTTIKITNDILCEFYPDQQLIFELEGEELIDRLSRGKKVREIRTSSKENNIGTPIVEILAWIHITYAAYSWAKELSNLISKRKSEKSYRKLTANLYSNLVKQGINEKMAKKILKKFNKHLRKVIKSHNDKLL